jgi:hypothetical protein
MNHFSVWLLEFLLLALHLQMEVDLASVSTFDELQRAVDKSVNGMSKTNYSLSCPNCHMQVFHKTQCDAYLIFVPVNFIHCGSTVDAVMICTLFVNKPKTILFVLIFNSGMYRMAAYSSLF